ncbi:hypothetical protein [Janthinobacterium sp.]|nr:hypothetical protein [Janthinobacterium sp.]
MSGDTVPKADDADHGAAPRPDDAGVAAPPPASATFDANLKAIQQFLASL